MSTVGSLSRGDLESCLKGGVTLELGPFVFGVRSNVADLAHILHRLYADYPLTSEDRFVDFRVRVTQSRGFRRYIRPYASFDMDGDHPFEPLPLENAFPLLEWGINWCVASTAHHFLMLHAAVVERDGVTVLMPALPGSGKSTLCAALVLRGWRLISDEFALISPGTLQVTPFPRCVPLKNESIDVIRNFAPEAVLGPTFLGTRKGDVAHLRPPRASVESAHAVTHVTHVAFPRFAAGSSVRLMEIPKARAFMKIASNSFNYELFGVDGFETVGRIVEGCPCFSVEFSDLEDMMGVFGALEPNSAPSGCERA